MKKAPLIIAQFFHIKGPLPVNGKEAEFSSPSITIGRHPSSQLRFPGDLTYISRQHAEIVREGNQFKLIDHSTNGTYVNGKRVKEIFLKDGDVLMFGEGGPQVSFLTRMAEGSLESEAVPVPPPRVTEKEVGGEPPRIEKPSIPSPPPEPKISEVSPQVVKVPLIIQYGPTIRSFKQLPVTIGKGPACDYPLEHPALHDQHAQIFFSEGQYYVRDLTGQKLVHIDRRPIDFQAPLKASDELALTPQGPFFRFFGEGRLGEVEEVKEEAPMEAPKTSPEPSEEKSVLSKLKKIFKS
ncbi:MAG: FHA domain-containing protein [Desulfobacterota bacterium]|nr:FHA domain-containing protein [Thermodesulfobacteriota bacterium]